MQESSVGHLAFYYDHPDYVSFVQFERALAVRRPIWTRLRAEDGMAAFLAVIVLGVMLTLAAGVFAQSVFLSDSTNKDEIGKRAFQAANEAASTSRSRA